MKQYPHKLYIDQTPTAALGADGNWQVSGEPFNPEIGDEYGGGIIFYLDSTGKHGLVCSLADISTGIRWYNGSYIETNATLSEIGRGDENTEKIIAAQGIGNYAASICRMYNGGGYADWVLPTLKDTDMMYENLHLNGLGNFNTETDYWTSTENSLLDAFHKPFYGDGVADYDGKDILYRVRAVREF